ncbi:MAG: hypothetical protein ACRYHA_08220 [Janthinobacterium lividum]
MGGFFVGVRRGVGRIGMASGRFDRGGRGTAHAAARATAHALGRAVEIAGTWLVSLTIGMFVVQLLLGAENRATRDVWRGERFALTLRQLADRFENDLALGLDPIGNGDGARMVDAAYGRDPALRAVLVIDRRGTILLDSDRGGVGERVSAVVSRAAAAGAGALPWRVAAGPQRVQGAAVHNAFGEWVADVMLTYPDASAATSRVALPGGVAGAMAFALAFVLACGFAVAAAARLHCGAAARAVAREQATGRRVAAARLAALEYCLETIECVAPREEVP